MPKLPIYRPATALANGQITQDERRQYRDYHLGLSYLNNLTDNLNTRILWANVRLPLGLILCADGRWKHIATTAKHGRTVVNGLWWWRETEKPKRKPVAPMTIVSKKTRRRRRP